MTGRKRVKNALTFKQVDNIPLETEYGVTAFESDVLMPRFTYGAGKASGIYGVRGSRTDYWGSVWESGEDGVKGEVKVPLINSLERKDLDKLYIPMDVLEEADLSLVSHDCETSGKFTMKMWGIEPFQRMQYLRGTEELLMDIALEDDNLIALRDKVHAFYKAEVELWAGTNVDAIHLEDDWGTQQTMLISPSVWRQLFKPLYKEYCDIAKKHGKLVVMHSDGNIMDIIPDLIEIGIGAINPQLNVMDYEKLSGLMNGKMALWGGIDRQWLLPFGTEEDIKKEVTRIAGYFCSPGNSGVVGQCFRDKGAKEKNLLAVYGAWRDITSANQGLDLLS